MKTENIGNSRNIIISFLKALFCISIGVVTALVMFNFYNPNQNTIRALSSVCMDVICLIILFVLVVGVELSKYSTNRTTRYFVLLLLATIWAVFMDFLNWAFDGSLEFGHLTFWFTVLSLCMGSVLACIFSLYLYSYMDELHALANMRLHAYVCAILNLFSFCLTFILAVTGTAFEFVDGHYELGALYDVVTIIPVLSLLYLTGFIVYYFKKVGLHDTFAVAGYIFFMIAGALIEASYGIGTTYVAVSIADIFIFVMLQNDIIAQEKQNVLEWMKKSNIDELTSVYNRNAYENDLAMMKNDKVDDDFVYVSVDVNSLKDVNDNLGHNAGDELLIGVAECLKKCIGNSGKLYRTGGDEFVAFINANEDELEKLKNSIEETTKNWDGKLVHNMAISFGYATTKDTEDASIKQMSVIADRRMYEAKAEYYRQSGKERRKKN